jgi:tripartite ATP-independent transporter DctM subunit
LLFLLIIGGIYGGMFTPSEAGGIGAFGALVIALIQRRLSKKDIGFCMMDTVLTTAMIMTLLIGVFIYMDFLALSQIPFIVSEFIAGLGVSRYLILTLIIIVFIILGAFFDIWAILGLTVPILFPVITAMGFNPIWFSVILVRVGEIGLVTPPFGLNLFALAGSANVPLGTMYRGVIPFVIADLAHVVLLVAIPGLSTFLPGMM